MVATQDLEENLSALLEIKEVELFKFGEILTDNADDNPELSFKEI